jgi:iron complex transport system permease protein
VKSWAVQSAILLGILFVVILGSLCFGTVYISVPEIVKTMFWPSSENVDPANYNILWLRLQRIVFGLFVGGGLAASGAGYQGLFRNPLADPYVIGASSGAALGATVAIVLDLQWDLPWQYGGLQPVPWFAMIGALGAVAIVYGIASTNRGIGMGGQTPTMSLLLAGVAVSSFASALVSLLMFVNSDSLAKIFAWLLGSLAEKEWIELGGTAPLIILGVIVIWSSSRALDALTFGEETASSMGIHLHTLRGVVVVAASLTTAACVATSGLIGFVGLVAPHAARLLVGPRHTRLIPASCVIGAILLLLADDLARGITIEPLPVGVVAALLGAPFFLYLLKTAGTGFGGRE